MEPEKDDLEDDFPFQLGDFVGSMLIFQGVLHVEKSLWKAQILQPHSVTHHLSTSTPGPSHQQQRGCGNEEENQFQSQTTQMSAATA